MLDWIVVDVIQVVRQVLLVANRMFPKSALPDAAAAIALPRVGYICFLTALPQPLAGERFFDHGKSGRKICVLRRQSPNCVKMIWKKHHRIDGEGMALAAGGQAVS